MKRYYWLFLALVWGVACADTGVALTKSVQGNETYYLAQGKSCELLWRVKYHKDGFGIRQDSSHCALPQPARQVYWDALLKKISDDTQNLQGFLAFQLGALKQGEGDADLSARLMLSAASAKEWDAKRGVIAKRPRDLPNLLVEKLLGKPQVFAELTQVFAKYHIQLRVQDVEEVLIQAATVDGLVLGRVPYNCLVSFSVKMQAAPAHAKHQWPSDDTIKIGQIKKKLAIHDIGASFEVADGIYFSAYRLPRGNFEFNLAGYISKNLQEETYWPVSDSITRFFQFQGTVVGLAFDGTFLAKNQTGWQKMPWQVHRGSDVVYSNKFIITCHSPSETKDNKEESSCEAPEKKWVLKFDWHTIMPKMCGDVLTIQNYHYLMRPPFAVVRFDPETGKEVARTSIMKLVPDICAVPFERLPAPQASK